MAQDCVDWFVELAEKGDRSVLDRLPIYLDVELAKLPSRDQPSERQRIATEFSRKAPNTALTKNMLAILQV